MMLSLPEDWNYTTRGLAKICKEGVDAIGGALRELEAAGYIVRHQMRDRQGRISDTEYVILDSIFRFSFRFGLSDSILAHPEDYCKIKYKRTLGGLFEKSPPKPLQKLLKKT